MVPCPVAALFFWVIFLREKFNVAEWATVLDFTVPAYVLRWYFSRQTVRVPGGYFLKKIYIKEF